MPIYLLIVPNFVQMQVLRRSQHHKDFFLFGGQGSVSQITLILPSSCSNTLSCLVSFISSLSLVLEIPLHHDIRSPPPPLDALSAHRCNDPLSVYPLFPRRSLQSKTVYCRRLSATSRSPNEHTFKLPQGQAGED